MMNPLDPTGTGMGLFAAPSIYQSYVSPDAAVAMATAQAKMNMYTALHTNTKEVPVALPKEKKPQGWKAAIIYLGAAFICWKLWNNRDEIVVKAEELGKELFDKLGLSTDKEDAK